MQQKHAWRDDIPLIGMSWYKGQMMPREKIRELRAVDNPDPRIARATIALPPSLWDKVRLIKLIRVGGQNYKGEISDGKMPLEAGWNVNANYAYDDPAIVNWVEGGDNYGVLLRDNLVVVDADEETTLNMLPQDLRSTVTVRTGRGWHLYFNCSDSSGSKIGFKGHLGDMRPCGPNSYIVGPGSIHKSGAIYTCVDPFADFVDVSWGELKAIFNSVFANQPQAPRPRKIGNSSSLTDQYGLHIEDICKPNDAKRSGQRIIGGSTIHDSASGTDFVVEPDKNRVWCNRCNVSMDPIAFILATVKGSCGTWRVEGKSDIESIDHWLESNGLSSAVARHREYEREEQRKYAKAQPLPTFETDAPDVISAYFKGRSKMK